MAPSQASPLGRLSAWLYVVGGLGFLISAFVFAVTESPPPRLEAAHATAAAVVVASWLALVGAAVLTTVRRRGESDGG